ncbi:MAG: T9SS type A sorting domain-containing protein [Aestuariibaculum sp.]
MKNNYYLLLICIIFSMAFQLNGFSQNTAVTVTAHDLKIEGLSIYPNPIVKGQTYVYIKSNKNLSKSIEIFDILGKRISIQVLKGKELNISSLKKGVYILKITENKVSETRKLVVK